MPQLRKNPVTREWVIIAEERSRRPGDFHTPGSDPSLLPEHVDSCPFCAGHEAMSPDGVLAVRNASLPEMPADPDGPNWQIRVVPNKFPALSSDGDLARRGLGMYDCMNGVGAHEVVIETPLHNESLSTLPLDHCAAVFWTCRQRFVALAEDRRFKYILLFRNQGAVAGASLEHPHSQIIALPMVPMEVMAELEGMSQYAGYRDRCPYCDMVNQERDAGARVVFETEHHLVFAPFASKFPYETWIVPREHQASFAELEMGEMWHIAESVQGALRRLDLCLGFPPYNLTLHTRPVNTSRPEDFHWHIQIQPRLTVAAGFEMGTGVYVNVTSPEQAAAFLREAREED